ncbi:MAG: co-chaperone GroES [Phycisphaerales bacterium JB043]
MATATKSKKINVNITPIGDKVIVQRDEAETMTDSGLYLPEGAKDTPKTGVVLAVGTGALNHDTGERIPMTLKKGDRVIFTSYSGTEIKVGGDEVLIMSEDEILATFD